MEKKILIPNAAMLMESMRSIGYSFETAVADIIDNSIFAKAKNIRIVHNVFTKEPYLLIMDDGVGMSIKDLESAMVYGARNPNDKRDENDLGRFGLGLKSASLSQCRELIVISKCANELSILSWDLDYVINNQEWAVKEYSLDEVKHLSIKEIDLLNERESGTIVLWRNFDRFENQKEKFENEFLKKIEVVEKHLSLVFHRFIARRKGKVNIFINNNEILPTDPFLTSNLATQKKPTQSLSVDNKKVTVVPYVLPHINKISRSELSMLGGKDTLRATQGYYIYRNKRLIIWGKWFGQYPKNELQKLVRIRVDIPNSLDYLWEIDVKKSTAVLPFILKRALGLTINKALLDGKNVFHYRGRKKNVNSKVEFVWDRIEDRNKISYKINKSHPLISNIIDSFGSKRKIYDFLELLEDYIPIQQIYNDNADSLHILNKECNTQSLEKARKLLGTFSKDEGLQILENPTKYEGLNLSNEEVDILRKEYQNGN